MSDIEARISAIEQRNKKVELDKKREISRTRKGSIMLITYIIASFLMLSIGDERFFLNALIPMLGYFLSTISIPRIEKKWKRKKG